MEIFLSEIPPEGLHRSGRLPSDIFDLSPEDSIRPAGEVEFDATIFLFEDVVTFTGSLRGPFELQCGTCLEYVPYEAEFSGWNSDLELEEDQESFDLREIIREDFLLALPTHPRCDEIVPGRTCPRADELAEIGEETEPEDGGSGAWKALDDL